MVSCLLCLKKATKHIKLSSKEGQELNCSDVIAKHFWLKPNNSKESKDSICLICWNAVRDFHKFYKSVAEAHNYLDGDFNISEQFPFTDPLPNILKSEEESKNDETQNDQLFDPEVKLEVNDLEYLPVIEVIERDVETENEPTTRITRQKRKYGEEKTNTKTTTKRIKHERSNRSEDDSETELPLSMLLQSNAKTESHSDTLNELEITEAGEISISTAENSELELPKKRRGRPRKVQTEKTASNAPSFIDNNAVAIKNVEFEVKVEQSPEHDDNDFGSFGNNSGTEDSAQSSSSESDETDSDSLPDWMEPRERYAEIPKRVVVKPKKYRKRPKPLVPPKRMTKEELEKKRLQQVGYDKIIGEFFEKIQCPKCNLLVPNFGDMRRHFTASHNDSSGYMECCGRKFQMRRLLAEHILLHSNPELFKCSICCKILQDSRTLEQHEAAHNQPPVEKKDKRTFECEKCTKKFTTKAAMEHHVFSKHIPKSEFKFPCTLCNKKFPTERTFKEHMKYAHDPESAVICEKCGKKMRSQYTLKKHVQLEHSEMPRPPPDPVQCEICGTWLRHMSGLKQHMKSIHEDSSEEHRCNICNKTSTNARALRRHIYLNHEAERKFKCTMCEKAFKRPQDLREHTSVHTGEVLYTCPNCPMTFFSNANMYKHRQRLHKAEYEAGRKKGPQPSNILRQAINATAESKMRQAIDSTSSLFSQ